MQIPHEYKGHEQWTGPENEHNRSVYRRLALMTMDELELLYPEYYDRLTATVPHAHGNVLEVGCGNGNITRWLAKKDNVKGILAMDISQFALDELKSYHYENSEKIKCVCSPIADFTPDPGEKFDTVMLSEVIEHISLEVELEFLEKIRANLNKNIIIKNINYGSSYVVSTPIGFMADPTHCRGFSREEFALHMEKYYGPIRGLCWTTCQQIAWGNFR